MKKKITITESELRNLVEGVIAEEFTSGLDYRTFINAMMKAQINLRNYYDAAKEARENGDEANYKKYKMLGDKYMKMVSKFGAAANLQYAKKHNIKPTTDDIEVGFYPDYSDGETGRNWYIDGIVTPPGKKEPEYLYNRDNRNAYENDDFDNQDDAWKWYKEHLPNIPSVQDAFHFINGDDEYRDGKWQRKKQQESLVRRISEDVIRRLKR